MLQIIQIYQVFHRPFSLVVRAVGEYTGTRHAVIRGSYNFNEAICNQVTFWPAVNKSGHTVWASLIVLALWPQRDWFAHHITLL